MAIIFSRSCEYGIQAVLYLARRGKKRSVLLREISDSLGIPHHFLSKVLQLLSRRGIVISQKGSTGGFTLAQPLNRITLADIMKAIDGEALLTECVLGFPECDPRNPCPAHNKWKEAKTIISSMLNQKTIGDLSKGFNKKLGRAQEQSGK